MKPWFALLLALSSPLLAQAPCPFDSSKALYAGTRGEQARCLLRQVKRQGVVGQIQLGTDDPLVKMLDGAFDLRIGQVATYLEQQRIGSAAVGGDLVEIKTGPSRPSMEYFVIHDVSSPNYHLDPFPSTINQAEWSWNSLDKWKNNQNAHLFIARTGESAGPFDLSTPWRATKFEGKMGTGVRGRFVHIELVQPRRSSDAAGKNDALAPEPGFTEFQLRRLALVYVVASVRAGHWLVPAFHAVIDTGIPDGHDDPQNFDLSLWSKQVLEITAAIRRLPSTTGGA